MLLLQGKLDYLVNTTRDPTANSMDFLEESWRDLDQLADFVQQLQELNAAIRQRTIIPKHYELDLTCKQKGDFKEDELYAVIGPDCSDMTDLKAINLRLAKVSPTPEPKPTPLSTTFSSSEVLLRDSRNNSEECNNSDDIFDFEAGIAPN